MAFREVNLFGPFAEKLARAAASFGASYDDAEKASSEFFDALEEEIHLPIESLIIYGSYARNCHGPSSDIDFLILTNEHVRGVVQGDAMGRELDGYIENLDSFLQSESSIWNHIAGGVDLCRKDPRVERYLAGLKTERAPAALSQQDAIWFNRMLKRIRLAKQTDDSSLLPLIAVAMLEYQKSHAKVRGWPDNSPTGWAREVSRIDTVTSEKLTAMARSINSTLIDDLEYLVTDLAEG